MTDKELNEWYSGLSKYRKQAANEALAQIDASSLTEDELNYALNEFVRNQVNSSDDTDENKYKTMQALEVFKKDDPTELKWEDLYDENTHKLKVDPIRGALQQGLTLEAYKKKMGQAREKWAAEQNAKMGEETQKARMEALDTEWSDDKSLWDNLSNKAVEFGTRRALESARNQVAAGDAPEMDGQALLADGGEAFLSTAMPGGRLIKLGTAGGKLARVGNIVLNMGKDAAIAGGITAGAEGLASAGNEDYDFNAGNIVQSTAGTAVPTAIGGMLGAAGSIPILHAISEPLEGMQKKLLNLPAIERMKFDSKVAEINKLQKQLEKQSGKDATLTAKELDDKIGELKASYPSLFTSDVIGLEAAKAESQMFRDMNKQLASEGKITKGKQSANTREINKNEKELTSAHEEFNNVVNKLPTNAAQYEALGLSNKTANQFADELDKAADELGTVSKAKYYAHSWTPSESGLLIDTRINTPTTLERAVSKGKRIASLANQHDQEDKEKAEQRQTKKESADKSEKLKRWQKGYAKEDELDAYLKWKNENGADMLLGTMK